ncbi:MAG TPA: DUF4363 family protein [Bacillota bacterium]|nr:DUF4363 family protein [Bacillota bacterium]HOK68877.1 DUF4363 family protein [Bacillota bacterium]HPP85674.1 DUF4363 family protein [Bacillota bacterium]
MKNFIIAVILLVLMIGFVTVNAIVIDNITDKLIEMADGDINELEKYWEEKYYYISMSTHLDILEQADISLVEMKSYLESGNEEEYLAAKQRFLNAVDEIKTGEKLVFYNIF